LLKVFLAQRHICSERVCVYLVEGRGFGFWLGWGHRVRLGIWMECTSWFHYWEGQKKKRGERESIKKHEVLWIELASLTPTLAAYMLLLIPSYLKQQQKNLCTILGHIIMLYSIQSFPLYSLPEEVAEPVCELSSSPQSLEVIQICLSAASLCPFI
jgi:hypothetical protein